MPADGASFDFDVDGTSLQLAAATILSGCVVRNTKRDGASTGQGMARVRAVNEDGKEELFQLFERRLHYAAWADVIAGDPLAFVVDARAGAPPLPPPSVQRMSTASFLS